MKVEFNEVFDQISKLEFSDRLLLIVYPKSLLESVRSNFLDLMLIAELDEEIRMESGPLTSKKRRDF